MRADSFGARTPLPSNSACPKPGDEAIEDDEPGYYRFPKYYQVFNAEQIQDIPPIDFKPARRSRLLRPVRKSLTTRALIADLTSAFLRAETGIPDSKQTAAYIASCLKALKNDKNAIFSAASEAAKATDFILQRERQRPVDERVTAGAPQRRARYR